MSILAPRDIDPEDFDNIDVEEQDIELDGSAEEEDNINLNEYKAKKVDKENIDFLKSHKGDDMINSIVKYNESSDEELVDYVAENKNDVSDENSDSEVEDGNGFVVVRKKHTKSNQSKHVKRQVNAWGKLVGIRIRLQPILQSFARFPSNPKSYSSYNQAFPTKSEALLRKMLEIQDTMSLRSNPKMGRKRSLAILNQEGQPKNKMRKLWRAINRENRKIENFYGTCFDAWKERLDTMSGLKSNLKSLRQSITAQVDATMSSSKGIVQRNQRLPKAKTFGNAGTEESDINTSIYLDSVFYQQLLRDFIAFSGNTSSSSTGIKKIKTKLRKSKKTDIDTRATKGRKLKYVVHEKLVNFVPSIPEEADVVDEDRTNLIFKSLFMKSK